ncbi:MAG: U32 family peptidase C-terminal domain-containing protein [Endomicrobium sp.]|jgi:putative protease|nr:U32 family peptidase C-terminal domain-containing protein [Endomicrobium sp.]
MITEMLALLKTVTMNFDNRKLRHKLKKGEEIEILSPFKFEAVKVVLSEIYNKDNNRLVSELAFGKAN